MAKLIIFSTDESVEFVEQKLKKIKEKSGDLFTEYYPLGKPYETDELDTEVWAERGIDFNATSMFVMATRPRKKGFTEDDAVTFLKKEFSDVTFFAEYESGGLL